MVKLSLSAWQEKKKATEDVQTALSRPPVVEYWKGSDQARAVVTEEDRTYTIIIIIMVDHQ